MDMVEMAIQKVCASKVYTSAEFKREKDNFHVSSKFQIVDCWSSLLWVYANNINYNQTIGNFFFAVTLQKSGEGGDKEMVSIVCAVYETSMKTLNSGWMKLWKY